MNDFTQLGIAGLTLAILFFVVRYFVAAMTKKDDYIQKITTDFTLVINNHIDHNTRSLTKFGNSIDKLTKAIVHLKK